MMVAETGAPAADQAAYLAGVQQTLPTLPDFKAFVYFDALGKAANWILSGSGLKAFHTLANSGYFAADAAISKHR
jgi:hypothetical protein